VAGLAAAGWQAHCHAMSDRADVAQAVGQARADGTELFVAAGGDGTVSAVAGPLVGSGLPVGILPLGTGNILARDLGIPQDWETALALLSGPHALRSIDAMRLGSEACYVLNVGIGLSALMMRDTAQVHKRRLGRLAYLGTGLKEALGVSPRPFDIELDGQRLRFRATEVSIANSGAVGDPVLRWGAQVALDDGQLDLCVVRARGLLEFLGVIWSALTGQQAHDPKMYVHPICRYAEICAPHPMPVEADGDFIGYTPLRVEVLPAAVRVIVPRGREQPQIHAD